MSNEINELEEVHKQLNAVERHCRSCKETKLRVDFSVHLTKGELSKECNTCLLSLSPRVQARYITVRENQLNELRKLGLDIPEPPKPEPPIPEPAKPEPIRKKRKPNPNQKELQRKWRKSPRGRYTRYKSSAKKRGLTFSLTQEELTHLSEGDCTYCGSAGGGVDRIDASIGYQLGNCVSCCTTCNIMKLDHNVDDWLAHLEKVVNHTKENCAKNARQSKHYCTKSGIMSNNRAELHKSCSKRAYLVQK